MSFASLYQLIIFSWQSFWRNIWLSIITITIIVLALVSVNFLIALNVITDTAVSQIQDKIDVSVYFKQTTTEPQVLEVKTYLSALAQVKDIKYISQQEALQNFRQRHQQNTAIIESLEALDQNPLGATLTIQAKRLEDYPEILSVLDNSKYNELITDKKFDDREAYINNLRHISETVNQVGLLTAAVFIFIAALIVFNTIRVAIYTHRQEIGIMKLVGAANWFIRGPFMIEGVWYGTIATLLTIGIMFPLINFIQPYVNAYFLTNDVIVSYFRQHFWQIFGIEFLFIMVLNTVSSLVAIRRYLKV